MLGDGLYIHTMESLAEYLGRDKLLELLKKIKDDGIKRESTINPEHILANLARRYKDKDHYKNTLTYRIIDEAQKAEISETIKQLTEEAFEAGRSNDLDKMFHAGIP